MATLMMGLFATVNVQAYDFEKDGIFYNVTSLEDLTVEVTYENNTDYSGNITIPEAVEWNERTFTVTAIGEDAFYYNTALETIELPNTITEIKRYAFRNCSDLKRVKFPDNEVMISDHAFLECTSLTSIMTPATFISRNAFEGCSALTYVIFSATEANNDWQRFVIEEQAFNGCNSLDSIVIYMDTPPDIQENSFPANTYFNATLFVPQDCKEVYASTEVWNNFSNIDEFDYSNPNSCTLSVSSIGCGTVSFLDDQSVYNNSITRKVKKESTIEFHITADYGYKLKAIQINGIDVPITELVTSTNLSETLWLDSNSYAFTFCPIPVTLTVQQAESGCVEVEAEYGQTRTVRIMPYDGWRINSVTLDGTDYTYMLDAENRFTTPELYSNAFLNVAFEQYDSDGVRGISADGTKVYAQESRLVIDQATPGSLIRIYDESGREMKSFTTDGSRTETTLPANHVYIVKTPQKSVKIKL